MPGDLSIWLERGRPFRLWRVFRRHAVTRGRTRPDPAAGCDESLSGRELVDHTWTCRMRVAPRVDPEIAAAARGAPVRLARDRDTEAYSHSIRS